MLKVQIVASHNLKDIYSSNTKINSILRTLIALNGTRALWPAVSEYVYSEEGKVLTADEIHTLYQATKWAVLSA